MNHLVVPRRLRRYTKAAKKDTAAPEAEEAAEEDAKSKAKGTVGDTYRILKLGLAFFQILGKTGMRIF